MLVARCQERLLGGGGNVGAMEREMVSADRFGSYEAPHLTVHGSVADVTRASTLGIFVDNNHAQGMLIFGNTSA